MSKTALMLALFVGIGALVGVIFYQQTRIDRLTAEAAMLREQARQQTASRTERSNVGKPEPADRSTTNSVSPLTEGQFQELLRLRGQVSVLKAQLAERGVQTSSEPTRQQASPQPGRTWTESDLTDDQRAILAQMTNSLKSRNSVADLPRLKDSLERWDELTRSVPADMKPVYAILKERVKERIAELEASK